MAASEVKRLKEIQDGGSEWQRWGPYLSERSWGTVREDYSPHGSAWNYLTHEMSRSKTYRWGEDGLAGVCDRYQLLCLSLALWNGNDPILKERPFGLIPAEGNHGEDLKEYYFYLDSTPTHSYMKYLYKYPQAEYPYAWLVEENGKRGGSGPEFELLDTGLFNETVTSMCSSNTPRPVQKTCVCVSKPSTAALRMQPCTWCHSCGLEISGAGAKILFKRLRLALAKLARTSSH